MVVVGNRALVVMPRWFPGIGSLGKVQFCIDFEDQFAAVSERSHEAQGPLAARRLSAGLELWQPVADDRASRSARRPPCPCGHGLTARGEVVVSELAGEPAVPGEPGATSRDAAVAAARPW